VSQPLAKPAHVPPASEQQVRSHAAELVGLVGRHGIIALAFASPGRLRGHVADDRDLFDSGTRPGSAGGAMPGLAGGGAGCWYGPAAGRR
jgi:hypothetical protein